MEIIVGEGTNISIISIGCCYLVADVVVASPDGGYLSIKELSI